MQEVDWTATELRELAGLEERAKALPADAPRALLSVRLSVLTDETTSPARQELDLRRFALLRGCRVVGVARDLNVSATKVPPWKRPELGDWINNRAPEFDQILFWKLDRFVRRISDLHLMIEWCKDYKKVLAADKDPIDLDSAYGEMMVTMIAGMARIEAANTGVRLESLWKYARTTARWVIGKPVYGYKSLDTSDGKRLVFDDFKVRVLRWVFAMLKRCRSVHKITQILNRAQVPSPHGGTWYSRNLKSILDNPALQGFRTVRPPKSASKDPSRIAYDTDGKPMKIAEAIFNKEEFDQIQDLLKAREKNGTGAKGKVSRFLGVMTCGRCSENLYKHVNKKKRKNGAVKINDALRCASRTKVPCGGPSFPGADSWYGTLTGTVLEELGDYEVVHRQYRRGAENLARVTELQESIKHYIAGLAPGGIYHNSGFATKQAEKTLRAMNTELGSIDPDSTMDQWEYKSTGLTYREHWSKLGMTQMEEDLVRAGIKFVMYEDRVELLIPDDVKKRLVVKEDYFRKQL